MTYYSFGNDLISANVPLDLPVSEDGPADVDLLVRRVDHLVEPVWQDLHVSGMLGASLWRFGRTKSGGWAAVFGEGCRAEMSPDLRHIAIEAWPAAPQGWIADVIIGWALVYRLAASGRPTFHGSAVADGVGAVTIMGPTMSGKSTYATAALHLGYHLLADDTVVMLPSGELTEVWPTATSVKLRAQARALRPPGEASRYGTFDDRTNVVMKGGTERALLRKLIFLDDAFPVGLHPLPSAADVVTALLRNTKVGHWTGDELHERTFDLACHLARETPAFRLGVDKALPLESALERFGTEVL